VTFAERHLNLQAPAMRPPKDFPPDAWPRLRDRLTEARQDRLERVAARRTQHIRLVVQDLYQPHNISACIRSAEGLGVLNVDVVNLRERWKASTVARGVEGWLRLRKWDDIGHCARQLKEAGYLLACGVPSQDAYPLSDLPVDRPVAVLFGNEHEGLDKAWYDVTDLRFTIPMSGLVESFNISVSAAVTMYDLTRRAKALLGEEHYYLGSSEREELLSEWVCRLAPTWKAELARR
jgi:tRNA (guanosine-2'-O-)-methyltransferase